MIHWLSGRTPAYDGAATMRGRSGKPIMRVHLAHMARSLHLNPRRQALRGVAADMLIARQQPKR